MKPTYVASRFRAVQKTRPIKWPDIHITVPPFDIRDVIKIIKEYKDRHPPI